MLGIKPWMAMCRASALHAVLISLALLLRFKCPEVLISLLECLNSIILNQKYILSRNFTVIKCILSKNNKISCPSHSLIEKTYDTSFRVKPQVFKVLEHPLSLPILQWQYWAPCAGAALRRRLFGKRQHSNSSSVVEQHDMLSCGCLVFHGWF